MNAVNPDRFELTVEERDVIFRGALNLFALRSKSNAFLVTPGGAVELSAIMYGLTGGQMIADTVSQARNGPMNLLQRLETLMAGLKQAHARQHALELQQEAALVARALAEEPAETARAQATPPLKPHSSSSR